MDGDINPLSGDPLMVEWHQSMLVSRLHFLLVLLTHQLQNVSLKQRWQLNPTILVIILAIDDEIVRVKTTPTNPATNPLSVFRGVFGTNAASHDADLLFVVDLSIPNRI